MASKDIVGFLTLTDKNGNPTHQGGNLAFRYASRYRVQYKWNTNNVGNIDLQAFPYKNTFLLDDADTAIGHGGISGSTYPSQPTGGNSFIGTVASYSQFRMTGAVGTVLAANIPRVFGCVYANSEYTGTIAGWGTGDRIISQVDVPLDYTQIGIVYGHPCRFAEGYTVTTGIGLSYVTYANGGLFDSLNVAPSGYYVIRIEAGADAGLYFLQTNDLTNHRLYLRCLDGKPFSATAAATVNAGCGPGRRAYFNEVSVIPLSTGTISTSGRFVPRRDDPYLRDSFIVKVVINKSGSTEAAVGTEQQGSYYLSVSPFTDGDGSGDQGGSDYNYLAGPTSYWNPPWANAWGGGANGITLDWPNQRVWFSYTNSSNQSGIGHWRWKTTEGFREVANYLGTATSASMLTPALTLAAGDVPTHFETGSYTGTAAGWVYGTIWHTGGGNGGVIVIKPNLTTLQYRVADGVPSANVGGAALDRSRTRTGTTGDVSTDGSNNVTTASGGFTNSDIGRVIKLAGLAADSGTYKIDSVGGGTTVGVKTLAGGTVTFTSQSGGTYEIGDRLYLLFSDAVVGAGKVNYMESMAPGTFLTRTVSMTNGATVGMRSPGNANIKYGQPALCSMDSASGDLYWLSTDVQQQINKYEVSTNTHTFRTIANVQTPSGGSGTIGTITFFSAIKVSSKFNDIWVGTDVGHVKLVKNDFTGANYKRYYGSYDATYVNPAPILRPSGGGVYRVRGYWEHADGRMSCWLNDTSINIERAWYSQASDIWSYRDGTWGDWGQNVVHNEVHDGYGNYLHLMFANTNGRVIFYVGKYWLDYQWDTGSSKWLPKEVVQTGVPNKSISDTTAPGCLTKPIHSGYEDTLYGLKIRFTPQGGATPPNNEFLGNCGQSRVTATDGTTTISTATFGGSGFVLGDVGKLLRIESGAGLLAAEYTVYKISAYLSATSVTLTNINGSAFSASASVGTLTYTVWDLATPGGNAGPETSTILLADGFSKDNTQDITGITYETFEAKTRLYENDEARKFCVENPLAVPGATATKFYFETYPRASPQYSPATSHHLALPGAELANGRQVLDRMIDKVCNGSGVRAQTYSSPSNTNSWDGVNANSGVLGWSGMVDFGKDVEIGYMQIRAQGEGAGQAALCTQTYSGLIANIYTAPNSGGTPAASTAHRTSGVTTFNVSGANVTTATLSSGDFLGSVTTGPFSNGAIIATQNTFAAPAATFVTGDFMKVLKITAGTVSEGALPVSYRIIAVSGDGSTVTVRNLDQTAKAWVGTASSLTYEVRDGVREEDMIVCGAHSLCVDRLLTSTSLQVRTGPNASIVNQSWDAHIPTWTPVKRVSYSTEAAPPDVKNNGTWGTLHGLEANNHQAWKIYADLTDLPVARRTGRYWKFTAMPRFATYGGQAAHWLSTFEFYDSSGNEIAGSKYTSTDQLQTNPDFYFSFVSRVDFIQAANDSMAGVGTFNGNVDLGGANGDTLTLTAGGNTFLGWQIGPPVTDGVLANGVNTIDSASSSFPSNAMVGRFIRITSGAQAGNFYRVTARISATQITVVTPTGGVVTWPGISPETGVSFTVHEGINYGGTYPDKFAFTADQREFTILTINDELDTVTIAETFQPVRTNQAWEIRRAGYETASSTVEPTKYSRLLRPNITEPVQTGDLAHDSRGWIRFFSEDIGAGYQRVDGVIAGGDGTFVGTGFNPDDVGRLLYIDSGVNLGIYEISVYTSATSITVKNHYTGAAVSLTADAGPVTYRVFGDRRFRLAKYVTGLRA